MYKAVMGDIHVIIRVSFWLLPATDFDCCDAFLQTIVALLLLEATLIIDRGGHAWIGRERVATVLTDFQSRICRRAGGQVIEDLCRNRAVFFSPNEPNSLVMLM